MRLTLASSALATAFSGNAARVVEANRASVHSRALVRGITAARQAAGKRAIKSNVRLLHV